MNDSKSKKQVVKMQQMQSDEPTALMGTQVALNIAQGVIDAMNEAGVTKSQITSWDQQELRAISKRATQKILGLEKRRKYDIFFEEKEKISHFYKTCFKDEKWRNPNFELTLFPEITGNLKRPEYIFPEMSKVIDVAFDSYADYFGKDKVYKAWKNIADAMDYKSIQSRPEEDYIFLHVGGDEPDLLNYSYNNGVDKNILFMTPLEGIIAAFRYRFETGKMYDVVGLTRLAALDQNGGAMLMCKDINGKFCVDSRNRDNRSPECGLRQVSF